MLNTDLNDPCASSKVKTYFGKFDDNELLQFRNSSRIFFVKKKKINYFDAKERR